MAKQPLITVIVPNYNTAQYLPKCIDSILAQTWNNIEIILVDDGSSDNSANIINDYKQRYPDIIKSLFQKNSGQGVARNNALNCMAGDYVVFVDSDDWILPEMFEGMFNNLTGTNSDVVTCNYQMVNENDDVTAKHSCGDVAEQGQNITEFPAIVFSLEPQVTSKLFRADLFLNPLYRFPANIWYEDLAVLPSILSACRRISKVPQYYYQYFKREGTTTTTYSLKVLDGLLATNHIEDLFKKESKFDDHKSYIFSQQLRICYLTCLRISFINDAEQRRVGYKVIREYLHEHRYLLSTKDFLKRDVLITKAIIYLVYHKLGNMIFYVGKLKSALKSIR